LACSAGVLHGGAALLLHRAPPALVHHSSLQHPSLATEARPGSAPCCPDPPDVSPGAAAANISAEASAHATGSLVPEVVPAVVLLRLCARARRMAVYIVRLLRRAVGSPSGQVRRSLVPHAWASVAYPSPHPRNRTATKAIYTSESAPPPGFPPCRVASGDGTQDSTPGAPRHCLHTRLHTSAHRTPQVTSQIALNTAKVTRGQPLVATAQHADSLQLLQATHCEGTLPQGTLAASRHCGACAGSSGARALTFASLATDLGSVLLFSEPKMLGGLFSDHRATSMVEDG